MRSLIDILDLSVEELDSLMDTAMDIIADPSAYFGRCRGKKLATLFFEPSTRTRLSFEAAMLDLGGSVLSVAGAGSSSAAKGESVADTARIVSGYADVIAMRHPLAGSALVAASNASIPVINAGDGSHFHPTQTLADLLTIRREKGRLGGLTVGICGDLKYGRTVHSLIRALNRYPDVSFVLISPEELKLPEHLKHDTGDGPLRYTETPSLEKALPWLDMLYMTRIQRERFSDLDEYERLKDSYVLDVEKMELAKEDCIVLHPLPRVNEISVKVDRDPRAAYFREAVNGKFMRMALILFLLEEAKKGGNNVTVPGSDRGKRCRNPRCIFSTEQELEPLFTEGADGKLRCSYCEEEAD